MVSITSCQSHCSICGLHFAGDEAFNLHLGGPGADPPWSHLDPREVLRRDGTPALAVKTHDGTCRHSPLAAQAGAQQFREARERARAKSRREGRRGLLGRDELAAVHEAATAAEAAVAGGVLHHVTIWQQAGTAERIARMPKTRQQVDQDATGGADGSSAPTRGDRR